MKTLKSLLMLCAGLSFCACNSDNEPQFPEGNGEVVVKIVPPTVSTRAPQTATAGSTVQITGTYTITLTASSGVQTETFTQEDWSNKEFQHTFTGVTNPIKVQVAINEGKASYTADEISNLQQLPASIPAYGETETFTPGEPVENGNKSTITYTANVKMAIPVARLEIGNITFHKEGSLFETLTVGGVYLDKLRDNGSLYSSTSFASQGTATLNYQFGTTENEFGSGKKYILGDAVGSNFIGAGAVAALPSAETVYAYNFFGATPNASDVANNPVFKIYFSNSKLTSEGSGIARYAMITKYKSSQNGDPITLENGKVYKIVGAELSDANIINDEENNTQYEVAVTVEEAQWTVATTYVDWAQ